VSSVKSLGSGLLGGLKSALGIHSPSLVMQAEVGVPTAQGVIQGFLTELKRMQPQLAVALQPANLIGGSITSPGGISGLVGAPAPSSNGPVIQIDMRGAYMMRDRDMDQFIDQISKRLMPRLTQAGVHIKK
jgi:hypothetical protein